METMILEKDGQKFEIPISQNHKAAFEERYGEGSLQRLYALLVQDCHTFTEIGGTFSLTRERIRQIYEKRLASYLPNKNGRERQRSRALSRIHFSGKKKGFPKYVLKVWEKAKKFGFSVSHVNHVYNHNNERQVLTMSKELLINGKLCKIYHVRNCYQPSPSSELFYAHVGIAKKDPCTFFIVAVNVNYISVQTDFIIPRGQLNDALIQKNKKGHTTRSIRFINLPLTSSKHRTNSPWRVYENAWHLLA